MAMTDEEAAAHAISSLDPLSDEQKEAKSKIESILNSTDPFIDIHELFALYNTLYFRSLLLPEWIAELMREYDQYRGSFSSKYTDVCG